MLASTRMRTALRAALTPYPASTTRARRRGLATATSFSRSNGSDPLALYKERVARKELEESEDQIRALVHLRRLSRALQDYSPPAHLLAILARPPSAASANGQDGTSKGRTSTTADPRTAALVQWLTLPQQLAESPAPQGLLLTGPPGTGKSMLADLFFDSLPVPAHRKWRRHYHHLLLEIYRTVWQEAERRRVAARAWSPAASEPQVEDLSSSGPRLSPPPRRTTLPKRGTGVLWKREQDGKGWYRILDGIPFFRNTALPDAPNSSTSTDLTTTSYASSSSMDLAHTTLPLYAAAELFLRHGHVLLFDELQLVDVASANLLKRVLEAYWRLGGVVVGTSNRLPEELYTRGVQREAMLGFLEALRERCPVHEMRDNRDYRRRPADFAALGKATSGATYFLATDRDAFESLCAQLIGSRQGQPAEIEVYSRKVPVPFSVAPTESHPSLARFSFSDLFDQALGPADYLQLASTYHTIIISSLPVLTLLQKNQARRLITFLDAVYEAGCRLVVCAQAPPDRLFFPEASEEAERIVQKQREREQAEADDVVDMSAKGADSPFTSANLAREQAQSESNASASKPTTIDLDSSQLIQSEVLSEAAQDTDEGFRPNVAAYRPGDDARGEAARRRHDSASSSSRGDRTVFEPRMTTEAQRADALRGAYAGLTIQRDAQGRPIAPVRDAFGFANLAIFTGEEERFAFQRAVSRLFEMSSPAWGLRKRWRPLDASALDIWAGGKASGGSAKAEAIVEQAERAVQRERERVSALAAAVAQAEAQAKRDLEAGRAGYGSSDFADEASFEHRTHRGINSSTTHERPSAVAEGEEEPDEPRRSRFGPMPAFPTEHHENPRSVVHGREPDESSGAERRDGPPRLSPVHVWGVQKWGKRAGRWGMGAEAFQAGQEPADDAAGRSRQAHDGGERRRE